LHDRTLTATSREVVVFVKATQLRGYAVEATDGGIGSVINTLFDDERWVVRYLVVDTGTWLPGRKVLVSPLNVRELDWGRSAVWLSLTRDQVKNSPDIDSDRPVSRQREIDFYRYYGYPRYWGGVGLWGTADTPDMLARADEARQVAEMRARDLEPPDDVHLRDAKTSSSTIAHGRFATSSSIRATGSAVDACSSLPRG
jgi:hypothetical protein